MENCPEVLDIIIVKLNSLVPINIVSKHGQQTGYFPQVTQELVLREGAWVSRSTFAIDASLYRQFTITF